jgi:hypothetical protein
VRTQRTDYSHHLNHGLVQHRHHDDNERFVVIT